MVFYRWLSIFCLALLAPSAPAIAAAAAAKSGPAVWTARGGELAFIWNRSLLSDLGIRVSVQSGVGPADRQGFQPVAVDAQEGLRFVLDRAAFGQFVGGRATLRAGFVLHLPDGDISLAGATLQPRDSDARTLELRDAQGRSWFYLDHMMLDIAEDGRSLLVHTMDLRVAPALAQRVGRPVATDWSVAQLRLQSPLLAQDGRYIERVLGGPVWPGTEVPEAPGQTYQADVFMRANTAQVMRCATSPTCSGTCSCDGPGNASDGYLVVAPNATLRNNTNAGSAVATVPGDPNGTSTALHAADIPWYRKFSAARPPYDNDQHPLLIWNLYRIDSAGRIEQVGRSAVKHAFVSTNTNCTPGPGSNNSTGAVLGLGCSDTYSTGNNDGIQNLGPRSEILPAKGLWGRCGSTADPDCNLVENGISGNDYEQRMVVRESQIPAGNSYYMESWYVVRDDINIYNTMASWPVTFNYTSSWSVSNGSPWALGPAINLWVNPATTSEFQKNSEIATGEGRARVAVKVTSLGGNQWRYDYAVMNFDFARAVTTGTPAYGDDATPAQRFRIVHNFGFDGFSVPLPAGSTVTQTFHDGDLDSGNDWSAGSVADEARWTAPADPAPLAGVPPVRNPLNWGTLFRFSLTTDRPPVAGLAQLHVAQAGDPEWLSAATLVPQAADSIFVDNFQE